ncbi:MAG: hypothetical protein HQ522_20445 [Bacteroidetes bacterium]|nr:hypothetical protein [Bacteroidota bacterium]
MKKILGSTFMLLFCTTMLFASKIDGKWAASVDTDNGTFEFTLTYKVDGEKLSGTMVSEMGELEFADGKVNGDTFEYKFEIEGYSITHKGKVLNDNEIQIKSSGDYGENEYVIKKIVK